MDASAKFRITLFFLDMAASVIDQTLFYGLLKIAYM
jgi:hypothetical protein